MTTSSESTEPESTEPVSTEPERAEPESNESRGTEPVSSESRGTEMTARGPLLLIAAAASASAGLVHAAAAGSHTGDNTVAILFAIAAAVQLGWAALILIVPARLLAAVGGLISGAMLLAWAASRTVGWPIIASMSQPDAVGTQDLIAALLAAVALVAAFAVWVGFETPKWVTAAPVSALATVMLFAIAVPAMAVEHSHSHAPGDHEAHGDDHDAHAPGDHEAHGDDHDVHAGDEHEAHVDDHDAHAGDDHGHGGYPRGNGPAYDHDNPIVSLDDPRLSEQQRAAAQALLDDVLREMSRFSDPASVEAEGYTSIGDGITGFEHFSHPILRNDPITMDPRRPESIVFRINPDGTKELTTAMFIMPPGTTMDDVPDIAGTLTMWHDHQDLCWMGDRVVGRITAPGECAFGEFRVGQAMMHVWLVPHPCGPFAGLEGHGGDCRQHH